MNIDTNLLLVLIAIVGVAGAGIIVFKRYADMFIELKKRELQLLSINKPVKINTEALERMLLFLERIKPAHLIGLFDKTLSPGEFVYLIQTMICQEFEYNVSQKLYLSPEVWSKIVLAKDHILDISKYVLKQSPANEKLEDYKIRFIMKAMEQDSIAVAIHALQNELR